MSLAVLLLLWPAAPALQDPPPPPPEEEVVEEEESEEVEEPQGEEADKEAPTPEEAANAIRDALRNRDMNGERFQEILEANGLVAAEEVTKELGKGVKHKEDWARTACLTALRWNDHESALDELLRFKRDKKLHETPATGVAFALGLGQKGGLDPESAGKAADVLGDMLDERELPFPVTQAAIRGLGRCRVAEAPEALMDFIKAGPVRAKGYILDLRVAMGVLLGHDAGQRPNEWTDWWSDEGKKLEVPEEPYEIPQERMRLQWEELWKSPMQKEQERLEREERMRKAREEQQREA